MDQVQFLVLFPRNVEPHRVGFEDRGDVRQFLTGGELMALARGPADDLSGSKGLEGLRATDSANAGPR